MLVHGWLLKGKYELLFAFTLQFNSYAKVSRFLWAWMSGCQFHVFIVWRGNEFDLCRWKTAIWNKNGSAPQSKVPLCLERTHVSCVRGNFELLRMDPQTFLLYSGLPKTSYYYYHLRVTYEDRKDNLCNLCHDFPYSNHCNSIASLEILTNFIPTGNRELHGVIFFSQSTFPIFTQSRGQNLFSWLKANSHFILW